MVAVENRGAVFPTSSKSSVSVLAINDRELTNGTIFHHLTGHYPTFRAAPTVSDSGTVQTTGQHHVRHTAPSGRINRVELHVV